jgi:hypothetical protein
VLPEPKARVPPTVIVPAFEMVPLTVAPELKARVPALVMVNVAPLLTVSERMVPGAVLIVGANAVPEGMVTPLVEPGTPLGVQLPAVAQAVLIVPFHVLLAPVTLKMPVPVPNPVSGLVTMTLRVPAAAAPSIVTFAVRLVELVNVTWLTVMRVPENVTFAPDTKFVPVMTTSAVAPWASEFGLAETTVGSAPVTPCGVPALALVV